MALAAGVILSVTAGCSQGVDQSVYDQALARIDSVNEVAAGTTAQLNELNTYLFSLSECIDSINTEQGIIVNSTDPETGRRFSRAEMRERLMAFSDLIRRQRERIAALSDSLKQGGSQARIAELSTLIEYLNAQLSAKEKEVNDLRAQVATGRARIEELSADVVSLGESNANLTRQNEDLGREMAAQTERMNQGFFMARTKKELEEMGILKGGFLKKSAFQPGNVDVALCQPVDMRTFNNITLNSKKPRLLTQAPSSSYMIENLGGGQHRLVIYDAKAFWSLSNIVIIQL